MESEAVFGISRIYGYPNSKDWVVEGRAYIDIYIGNVFTFKPIKNIKKTEVTGLDLISIMTYGKVIDFLSSGVTGALYIKTDMDLGNFKEERLYLLVPSYNTRFRICEELLKKGVNDLSEAVMKSLKSIEKTEMYSEIMQFHYRYKSYKDIERLVDKYK
jgi:hypothetical protein